MDKSRRMHRWARITLLTLATAFAACLAVYCTSGLPIGTASVLASSEQFTIFALYPYGHHTRGPLPPEDDFHEFEILGRAEVTRPELRAGILRAVDAAVRGGSMFSGAACFSPRHGIRAVKDGRAVDLVICFECISLRIYSAGEQYSSIAIARGATELNELYQAAGVAPHPLQRPAPTDHRP